MAVNRSALVRIRGLSELRKGLQTVDRALPRELKASHLEIARVLAERAAARGQSQGSVAAKAAGDVAAKATPLSARLVFGGQPWDMGAEFGGGRRPRTRQFLPWRGNAGYFLFPTVREHRDEIGRMELEHLARFIDRVLPG